MRWSTEVLANEMKLGFERKADRPWWGVIRLGSSGIRSTSWHLSSFCLLFIMTPKALSKENASISKEEKGKSQN